MYDAYATYGIGTDSQQAELNTAQASQPPTDLHGKHCCGHFDICTSCQKYLGAIQSVTILVMQVEHGKPRCTFIVASTASSG